MRSEGMSLQQAAREAGVTPNTVKRWAGSALRKLANGRWAARKRDSLLRVLKLPTPDGMRDIAVKSSSHASTIADYFNAVHHYLRTGDSSRLKPFHGKSVKDADGNDIPLLTNPKDLHRLGYAGVLSFESLYAKVA
jgi:lambda repressor-like predicted transcriptional regulator